MNFNKKTLSITIACLLGSAAMQANSALIELEISGETEANITGESDANGDSNPTSVNINSNASNDMDYANANARGDDTGWFYSTANAYNNASAQSAVTQSYTVTNDSSDAQFFDFSFEVNQGSISANCSDFEGYGEGYGDGYGDGYGSCDGTDYALASYQAEIFLNGAIIWGSSAEVIDNANGALSSSKGTPLNYNTQFSENFLSWDVTNFTIELGAFSANESFELEYIVSTTAESFNDDMFGSTNAYAQFGDPNGFGQGNVSFTTRSASVPVPATLGLFGLGLAGLSLARRRKTKA